MSIMDIIQVGFDNPLNTVHPVDQAVPVQAEIIGCISIIPTAQKIGIKCFQVMGCSLRVQMIQPDKVRMNQILQIVYGMDPF